MNENTIPLAEKPEDVKLREGNVITHQPTEAGWVPYIGSRVLTMDDWRWAEYRDHIVARCMKVACPCCMGIGLSLSSKGSCKACGGTGRLPALVLAALMRYARQHEGDDHGCPSATELARQLKWNVDHFYFERSGVYHGVELDGQIHT
jgi:hypothetical protein